jgi:hypothetical protein
MKDVVENFVGARQVDEIFIARSPTEELCVSK